MAETFLIFGLVISFIYAFALVGTLVYDFSDGRFKRLKSLSANMDNARTEAQIEDRQLASRQNPIIEVIRRSARSARPKRIVVRDSPRRRPAADLDSGIASGSPQSPVRKSEIPSRH